ncbi:MAG: hypothetical protein Q4Q53_07200 [Methanocorpusculum sp.]|nr:hypothetical protein [Methanocorpusculum sp.]
MMPAVISPENPLRNTVETMRAATFDYSDNLMVAAYYYYIGNGSIIIEGETARSAQKILFDGLATSCGKTTRLTNIYGVAAA